ncbi:hypothetical protein HWV62_40404 [Athelia sp. TMB]|nr:hypothetical protein HWV62_40404 [Athelia sp. TMB]
MHRCLIVPEILSTILSSVNISLADLYQVALVCKSFCDPALDVLWGKGWMNLADLVKCLPADSLVFEVSGGVLSLADIGKLTLKDVERFHSYAGRIRKIKMPYRCTSHSGRNDSKGIHFATQEALKALTSSTIASDDTPLLPKLTHFHGRHTYMTSMNYLKWFIGPKLRDINITLGGSSDTIMILHSIKLRSPNLRKLSINGSGNNTRKLARYLSAVIVTFQNLQEFSSKLRVSEDMLSALGRLPTLRTLWLSLVQISPPESLIGEFPRLEIVRLFAHSMDSATAFIKRTQAPPIRNLYIQVGVQPSMTVLGQFSDALLKHLSRDVLESLELSLSSLDHDILDPRVISPLLKFKNMREFTLVLQLSLERVDNVFFEEMVHSWPQLKRLSMPFVNKGPLPTSVTLDGLRALSACPHLTTITLAMDARIETMSRAKVLHACSNSLRSLDFGFSKISDPNALAAFLWKMFPNLGTIQSGWTDHPRRLEDEQGNLWVECEAAFARRRERDQDPLETVPLTSIPLRGLKAMRGPRSRATADIECACSPGRRMARELMWLTAGCMLASFNISKYVDIDGAAVDPAVDYVPGLIRYHSSSIRAEHLKDP